MTVSTRVLSLPPKKLEFVSMFLASKMSARTFCTLHNLPLSTFCSWKRNVERLKAADATKKKQFPRRFPSVEAAVVNEIKFGRGSITGWASMRLWARKWARNNGIVGFRASKSWLHGFRRHHELTKKKFKPSKSVSCI